MPMSGAGIVKLIEEVGELQIELGQLQQVLAKKLAYMGGPHPDGAGDLNERIENEMGDLLAAFDLVSRKLGLNILRVHMRRCKKLDLFAKWDADTTNNQQSFEHK